MKSDVKYVIIIMIIALLINIYTGYLWIDNKYTRKFSAIDLMLLRILFIILSILTGVFIYKPFINIVILNK